MITSLVVAVDEISDEHAERLANAIKLMNGVTGVTFSIGDVEYFDAKSNARFNLQNELREKIRELQSCLFAY